MTEFYLLYQKNEGWQLAYKNVIYFLY